MKRKNIIFNIVLWVIMLGIIGYLTFMSYDLIGQEDEPLVPQSVMSLIKGTNAQPDKMPETTPTTVPVTTTPSTTTPKTEPTTTSDETTEETIDEVDEESEEIEEEQEEIQ